jgi:hypothetical protein
MAVRTAALLTKPETTDFEGISLVQWTGLTKTTDDSGSPVELPNHSDRSVQVTGTFGTGGSVRIEGSNDGTNYAPLTDPQGNDLNITAAKIEAISEATRYIRPRVTAGDVSTALAVTILFKR